MLKEVLFGVLAFLGLIVPVEQVVNDPPLVEGDLTALIALPLIDTPISVLATSTASNDDIRCFCVAFARTLIPSIPYPMNADQLAPNSRPDIGTGILFNYNGGVRHIAVIVGFTEDGWSVRESNKAPCQITERVVRFDDPSIIGFYR